MSSQFTSAEERAAAWAARLEVSSLSREEAQQLQAWLELNPSHESLLEEFTRLHSAVKRELPVMEDLGLLRRETFRPPSRWRIWTGGFAAAAAVAFAAAWYVRMPDEIATSAAHRQEVVLADGSHLALNARTALTVSLRGNERRVNLTEGEAYFEVAQDDTRPFFVETRAGTIRVTGTRFNVRADVPDSLEVTVLEGSVAVHSGGAEESLRPGDQLAFNGVTVGVRKLDESAALDVIAWRDGRLIVDGAPLRVVLERYSRYYGIEIEVSPAVETLPIGGIFKLDDLDGFLRDARAMLPVDVLQDPGNRRIRVLAR